MNEDGLTAITKSEHSKEAKAKRIQIRGLDPADSTYYNVAVKVLGSTPSLPVAILDGSGTQVTSFGGGTQYADGAVRGTATGTLAMGDDGTNIQSVHVDSSGDLQIDVLSIAAGDNNIGNVDIASAIPAGTNNIGDVDVLTVPADPFGANADAASATGSISAKLRFITSTGIPITGTVTVGSHAVTNAGVFVVQIDGAALTALQLIDDMVFADDAAFTLSTSKGGVAAGVAVQTDGTDPTAVSAEGDVAALRTDMQRNLIVNQTHPRFWHVSADYASAQTNTSVKAAPGASLSLYITDIQVSNGATAGNITLLDGSGGTVLYELYPAINGGAVMSLRSPIKLTVNTALCITSTTVTTHSIFVSGYIAP